ncbi:OLC1v1008103C1 [Oldenlandia corymbosa var. corymbosa]|uniref:OLC1v1008103C1 n=1 Tax=Oldenlandia corymbosa var. corymbosa TaxID=529605 RepID=A0AAV1DL78_OLDCO|nr:OLC1v1008103C1 [Oldenlandia corymbosa var. corymbosa]
MAHAWSTTVDSAVEELGWLKQINQSGSPELVLRQEFKFLMRFTIWLFTYPSKDFVEILKDNLIFMTSFIMDLTPKEETVTSAAGVEVLLRLRAKVVVDELLSLIFSLQKDRSTVEDISSLQLKIDKVKAKIRELFYVPFLNPLDFTFPMTNVLGSVNFFLENLKAMVSRMAFGKNQVMIIQAKLISFKSFLEDIMDKAKEIDDQTNLWRRIVKLVFIAEHVISSCLVKNHPIWYDMLRLSDVILAFNLIEIKVKRYSEHQKHKNRLMTSSVTKCSHVSRRQVIPSSLEDVMVDLKDESMKITEKLNLRTKQLQIVSIVGMAGLGKTTIAKKVYHDPSTTYNFERRAWCCVSQSYNLREMFLDILTDVTGVDARQSDYESTDDDLALKLRRSLRQLRYLIVLDDIWNMEAWECLKPSFPDDKKGSRIIFTSRIQNLVWQAELINCSVHSLRSLSDRESWELFHRKLCHYHGSPLDEEQSKLGKSIVKNCKGLPLSVVLVAGILAGQDIESWKQIECSTSSKFVSEGCMDVLELSYNHLPNHLKPCLLYVGGFPEDTVIKAQKLMSLWIAEGLVPRSDNKSISLYKVAEDYLSDLSSRSLVIPEKRSFNGSIKVCRVHDLIHDLCLVKSRKDNFLQPVQDNDIISVSHSALNPLNYESYYRLCISAEWTKFINAKPAGPLARSLVALRGDEKWKIVSCASDIFHTFRLLNVLDLECVKIDGPFPKEVTLMVNLRYLAIYCVASELPSSIANLWNLEILILLKGSSDGLFSLPRTFVGMKSLRYISIPWVLLSDGLEDHEHSQLEHLEMFSMLYAKTANQLKFFLRRLPRLRKLKCDLFFFFEDDQFLGLSRLTQLESLDVKGPGSLSDSKKWDHFPVLDFPGSLRKLSLQRFLLPWSAMSTIGQLPNLEVLKLNNEAFSGGRWDVEDGAFLKLKYLQLNTLDFEEWTVQDDPFPCLEQLIVKRCPRLHGIPPDLGNITTLKKIKMYRSAQASSSVREIFEEQRELGNDFLEVVIDGDHLKRP